MTTFIVSVKTPTGLFHYKIKAKKVDFQRQGEMVTLLGESDSPVAYFRFDEVVALVDQESTDKSNRPE